MSGGNVKAAVAFAAGLVVGAFTLWAVSDPAPPDTGGVAGTSDEPSDERSAGPSRTVADESPESRSGTSRTPGAPSRADRAPRARAAVEVERSPEPAGGVAGRATSAAGRATPQDAGAPSQASEPSAAKSADVVREPPSGTGSADPGPSSPEREARGVVVDGATQAPIEGARILLAAIDGPQSGAWWGDTSDKDGRFSVRATDERALPARFQLRVSRDGYDAVRVAPTAGEIRVQLRTRATPMLPGRVLGTARTAAGKPFEGEVEIEGFDEHGGNVSQRAVADALGKFALEGVPPGRWRMGWLRGPRAEVTVPEGGDATIEVAPSADGRPSGLVVTDVDPSAVRVDDPAGAARLAELLRLMAETQASEALGETVRERILRAYALEVQTLAGESHATLPRRAVTVTGLAPAGRAWLRLEWKPRHFWRVEVRDGAALFPPVAVGEYTAVLVQPGSPDVAAPVVVSPGEGVLVAEFRR